MTKIKILNENIISPSLKCRIKFLIIFFFWLNSYDCLNQNKNIAKEVKFFVFPKNRVVFRKNFFVPE